MIGVFLQKVDIRMTVFSQHVNVLSAFGTHAQRAIFLCLICMILLSACSTNPATGKRQFTALMSPAQEQAVGAQEHRKIAAAYGIDSVDPDIVAYVRGVGERVAQNVERTDVTYKFYVLDTEMVNAFALPGGYVYVTRGLLALANSEAELAAVLGHEIGHITARHSAERYSHGVLTQLGATILSTALDSGIASQAIGLSSNVYMSSYSRSQESEADDLGIRYAYKAGYKPQSMAWFLESLDRHAAFESKLEGEEAPAFSYFSTHPRTADRVKKATEIALTYPQDATNFGRGPYLASIDGLIYGPSAREGYVRGRYFYHPEMDFTFEAPEGFEIENQPDQVVAKNDDNAVIIFDVAANGADLSAENYLTQIWMKGDDMDNVETISIHGKNAATGMIEGRVNNRPVTIRLVAVEWSPALFYRFHVAYPRGSSSHFVDELKRATYSLRTMTDDEKMEMRPYMIDIITASKGSTVQSIIAQMPYQTYVEERFRALNALAENEPLQVGQQYKTIDR